MTTVLALDRRFISGAVEQRGVWVSLVRSACDTQSHQPPHVVTATTVSARFDGLVAIQREDLLSLARHIAGEYGLRAEVEATGTHLVARFSRPAN